MITTKQLEEAALKTVGYLYPLDDSCPTELKQGIAMLRQLINEEFVLKGKSVSNQFIWDILKPYIKGSK